MGLRILLTEGSSTSAREAVTALGLSDHHVEICDPDPLCLSRWSRFVRKFHRCPGLRDDPEGFCDFILVLVATGRFDVLLPIHEQGFALTKVGDALARHVGVALPDFATYQRLHSKVGFHAVLSELGLPQPPTRLVHGRAALLAVGEGSLVVKLPVGTASRGVWLVSTRTDLERAAVEIEALGGFDGPVLVQDFAEGPIEHAQAVFAHGELVACHGYAQKLRGLGGGEALKESVDRPLVRRHMAELGRATAWHGALSVDYVLSGAHAGEGVPLYFDCNPRLVEPMAARLAGLDLADLLVRVSVADSDGNCRSRRGPQGRGKGTQKAEPDGTVWAPFPRPSASPGATLEAASTSPLTSQPGIRTRLALQAVLGTAAQTGSRSAVLRCVIHLLTGSGPYANAREELTPFAADPPSVVPVIFAALAVLASPAMAERLAKKGWGKHLLDRDAAARIAAWPDEG